MRTLALRTSKVRATGIQWRERREFYPQGVASADPHPDSAILWTRRPPISDSVAKKLNVEGARGDAASGCMKEFIDRINKMDRITEQFVTAWMSC